MDLFIEYLNKPDIKDWFIMTLPKKVKQKIHIETSMCEWEPFQNKFKCKKCGFVSPRSTIKRNCNAGQPQKPPNMAQRAVNFGKAAVQHVATGGKHCSEEQKQARFAICNSNQCGYFIAHENGGTCGHKKCGCRIRNNGKIMDKLSWADSSCPVGKWGPITAKNPENGV